LPNQIGNQNCRKRNWLPAKYKENKPTGNTKFQNEIAEKSQNGQNHGHARFVSKLWTDKAKVKETNLKGEL
jgi:hypothetical protein